MSISLISALKIIPWVEVLTAAPAIVQGAEKLWGSIARKPGQAPRARTQAAEKPVSQSERLAAVDERVRLLELQVAELGTEVQLSSELIKSLAQQNAQLVQAVDILRMRTRILLAGCGGLGLAAVAAGLWFLLR